MAVEFQLLGDVQARVDGRIVELGHARQRCVLAALLVDANRPVPFDRLAERVWGAHTPQRQRGTLYTYISRLRAAIAAHGEVVISRQPIGYLLAVDPLALDLHRFRHLANQVRQVDGVDALGLAEQALRLWRGEAFAGLDTPWLNAVRERLERERFAVELDRNDLALRHGHHAQVLPEVSAAAARHPLDERIAGQLLLALYRSGRQADALAGFDRIRRRLADQLGADPGPPLRQLHRQILRADPAVAAPADEATLPVHTVAPPRQLPTPPRAFTGRVAELAQLDAMLRGAQRRSSAVIISVISGTAGVGKTALAVHWSHRVHDQFPDGQLYADLRGFDSAGAVRAPADAMRGFLEALDVPPSRIPADLDAQAALYRTVIADKRLLVVLDNARDADQVRPLLPGSPASLVLVTSRNALTSLVAAEGAYSLVVGLMTPPEARDLLADRIGAQRLAADPATVDQIITRCVRLPLALSIVAARAAVHPTFPLAVLADELSGHGARLSALSAGDPASDIRAVFSWSYDALLPAAARLFRLLGVHPGQEISAGAAASLAGVPVSQARVLLAELTRAHLLVEHSPARYSLHDLLHAYACERAETDESSDRLRGAVRRTLDHYLHTAYAADRLLSRYRDPIDLPAPQPGVTPERIDDADQALTWFSNEHAVLVAAVAEAASRGFDTHAWTLTWTLVTYFDRRGYWHDWAATQRLALDAAQRSGNRAGQASAHRDFGRTHLWLGQFAEARVHLDRAAELFEQMGDRAGRGRTALSLARLWENQGRHRDAVPHAHTALEQYRAADHRSGQAHALNMLGWEHALLGEHDTALAYCEEALPLMRELGDVSGEANTLDSIGYAYHHRGDRRRAVGYYLQAIELCRAVRDRYNEATALIHLGDAQHDTGDSDAAGDAWRHAVAILDDLGHTDADELRAKLGQCDHVRNSADTRTGATHTLTAANTAHRPPLATPAPPGQEPSRLACAVPLPAASKRSSGRPDAGSIGSSDVGSAGSAADQGI